METRSGKRRMKDAPVEQGNTGEKKITEITHDLLNIFPEEIWRLILKNVDNASDYYKICEISPLLQRILYERRTQALFPDVWQIMFDRLKKLNLNNDWNEENPEEHNFTGRDNSYFRHLFKDWKLVRQVCRAWRKGVDKCFQNLNYHFRFLEDQKRMVDTLEGTMDKNCVVKFVRSSDFDKFTSHFDSTHCSNGMNPFTWRTLKMLVPSRTNQKALANLNACLSILKIYGRHVWYLKVSTFVGNFGEELQFYQRMKKMFHLMPNLKVVQMENLEPCNVFEPTKAEWSEICKDNQAHPFPSLPNLSFVEQIEMNFMAFWEFVISNNSNLKQIGIELQNDQDFRSLRNATVQMLITKLRIDMSQLNVRWREIFSALEAKFMDTLEVLYIWLPKSNSFDIEDRLRLTKLKTIEVKFEKAEPLDFLLGIANSLEDLTVLMKNYKERNRVSKRENEIKFYKQFEKPYTSNIWEKFPNLTTVAACPNHSDNSCWWTYRNGWVNWKKNPEASDSE